MSFATVWGGYSIIDDIIIEKKEDGKVIEKGNGLKPLFVTGGRECSYDSTDDNFKEIILRGTPQPKKINAPGGMNWLDVPVFRAMTNRYTEAEWKRFLKHYVAHVNESLDRVLFYEPDLMDIEIRDYDTIPLHFPAWVLTYITEKKVLHDGTLTIFDEAKNYSKVNSPSKPTFAPGQYEKLMKAIEYRLKSEAKESVKA
jgi:hypothetical protein